MSECEKILKALANVEKEQGAEAVAEIVGPELSGAVAEIRKLKNVGAMVGREIMLKTALYWDPGADE